MALNFRGNDHLIEFNEIHSVVADVLRHLCRFFGWNRGRGKQVTAKVLRGVKFGRLARSVTRQQRQDVDPLRQNVGASGFNLGELHHPPGKTQRKTADNHTDDSLKAGPRGPTLMEDFHFREKLTHFDHESIPERVVHARGSGAHGYFEPYESMAKCTKAQFLSDPSVKTPVFVRFSTVVGSRGSADTVRDVRGFATKFYTCGGGVRPGRQQHASLFYSGRQ